MFEANGLKNSIIKNQNKITLGHTHTFHLYFKS
jgi:hypothetical protein